jgi:Xaa-Pro dipeptidase
MGADNGSSFCAVQFGRATAFPHGLPGDQALAEGDLVLIDTGCQVQGYNADITRTYVFGDPTPEQRRIWEIEHEAQAAAFAAVCPGVACEVIDATARAVLERYDLGPDYRFSNEPMIVIPDRFGVRLEDHFYVTPEGAAWFTEPSPSIDAPFG